MKIEEVHDERGKCQQQRRENNKGKGNYFSAVEVKGEFSAAEVDDEGIFDDDVVVCSCDDVGSFVVGGECRVFDDPQMTGTIFLN